MLSQRSRLLAGLAAACAVATVTACSGVGGTDPEGGPPRISPEPRPEAASAMVDDVLEPRERLDTCGLLGLTVAEIIELTGAEMPVVEPTGLAELGMPCTYGGPGSPERLQASLEAAEDATETTTTATTAETETAPLTDPPGAKAPAPVGPGSDAADLAPLPLEELPIADTVAAGVTKPLSGSAEALAGQPVMLGSRYACSEVRGEGAGSVPGGVTGVPEAPEQVAPDLASPYIDCIAAPTGGGVEAHTIFVADNDLWHLTFVRPGTPRSPETDAEALEGLHRVAQHVLS